ncbi:MAG: hypothetical protein PHE53_10710 [Thermoguttaceae bacterium]|nr:hypothetical protein [Thermoguttaceae bacterium]
MTYPPCTSPISLVAKPAEAAANVPLRVVATATLVQNRSAVTSFPGINSLVEYFTIFDTPARRMLEA